MYAGTYSEDALNLLTGSIMQEGIRTQQAAVQNDYDTMKSSCPDFKDITAEEYKAAVAVVGSMI